MSDTEKIFSKIALTGGCSFLGNLFLKRVADMGHVSEVHIFDVSPPQVVSKKFIFHRVDITKDSSTSVIANTMSQAKIDVLIHGALFSGPSRNKTAHHEVETIGTFNVLNACAEANIKKLIVTSATFVYGAYPKNPNFMTERTTPKPLGPDFVKSRVDAEQQIQEFAKDYSTCAVTVLRFAPILGPNSTNVRARYFVKGMVPKVLGYDPLLQFIHEEDALKALVLALSSEATGVFNVVGKGVIPLSTAVHLSGIIPIPIFSSLCKTLFATGYHCRIWDLSSDLVPFFQYLCVADGKKAKELLNFEPQYSSRQALKSMIEASRLREIGFEMPSSSLGEDQSIASSQGFYRMN